MKKKDKPIKITKRKMYGETKSLKDISKESSSGPFNFSTKARLKKNKGK